ncbi:RICIN domain-containing protein [Phytohabitans suffuscus]|uniref:RICIN domain-containing protein n=1 Tax=Phytohabitans suffuscus TaxID=624315 RepID=UPI001565CE2D|nr:RICIN domain-containing protein [Phytohabitans suffuscus]
MSTPVRRREWGRRVVAGLAVALMAAIAAVTVTATPAAAQTYRVLKALHSGKCLDVVGGSMADGARVQQWACNSSTQQIWLVERVDAVRVRYVNLKSGKCLDVQSASTADGAAVQQWTCLNGAANQSFNNGTQSGGYQLRPRHSDKCLDVAGGSYSDGARLQQWSCFPSKPSNQHFYHTA